MHNVILELYSTFYYNSRKISIEIFSGQKSGGVSALFSMGQGASMNSATNMKCPVSIPPMKELKTLTTIGFAY